MKYTVRCYVQLSRVYLEFHHTATNQFYVIYADHQWKPHTWHHVEVTWVGQKTVSWGTPPAPLTVPANATLFVDGVPAASVLAGQDVNAYLGKSVLPIKAVRLPEDVRGTTPNNNVGIGPRFCVGSKLQSDASFGMTQPSWIGTIDNLVMHHWRSHDAAFTPRNRYHSMTYFDGTAYKSGRGMNQEKAGVYKKRIKWMEDQAMQRRMTVGTLTCSHYHPWHVHLYGHDGAAPTTSFGHITPMIRVQSGGTFNTSYYYDGCAGLSVRTPVAPGSEVTYVGWFEVASLVPVTMSPILCDITVTAFSEPVTYFRLSSSEARH